MNLYYAVFTAGHQDKGTFQIEMMVHAESAHQVEDVCQLTVRPLQIISFERKTLHRKPKAWYMSKREVA